MVNDRGRNGITAKKNTVPTVIFSSFSGDTGFYSGCRKLYVALQEAVAVEVCVTKVPSAEIFAQGSKNVEKNFLEKLENEPPKDRLHIEDQY